MIHMEYYLVVSTIMMFAGIYGFFTRRNTLAILISVELMLNATDINFAVFNRYFYPDAEGRYSWWSYRFKAREKNAGWRIDYFITSPQLKDKLESAEIHSEIMGSDHCPVELQITL